MRVLILALSLGNGGVARYIEEIAENQSKVGDHVVLLYIGEEDRTDAPGPNLKVVKVAASGSGLLGKLRSAIDLFSTSMKVIREDKLDTFMGNTPFSNIFGHMLAITSSRRLRVLRIVHGMWAVEVRDLPEARKVYGSRLAEKLLPMVAAPLESWELKRSDIIVAVSDQIRGHILRSTGRNDVSVITAGVNIDKFHPSLDKKSVRQEIGWGPSLVVLFVGVICQRKGLDALIEAASRAIKEIQFELVIVGGGMELPKYQAAVLEKGYDFITFAGRIPDDQLIKFYQAADVYCLTSTLEGMPQTLLEAMSSGLACISTDVGGISTLIRRGENGMLISVGDIETLTGDIVSLLNNEGARAGMGSKARASVIEEYSWNAVCKRIKELVENT